MRNTGLITVFVIWAVLLFVCDARGTNVSGYQWGTWTADKSPYVLTGNVTVVGREPLNDRNGNGVWDDEEPWYDYGLDGEPDTGDYGEDNGRYDCRYGSCEPFDDLDGDGSWDPAETFTDLDKDGFWTALLPPLTISSGVRVEAGRMDRYIFVYGQLRAEGVTFAGVEGGHL
ncbi:MAG: hypothetical protein JRI67_11600, partial [Deltaproteobacteria bacterium]|nr:hypothetical protein [Deltaproteobacteria bacterium]